MSKTIFTPLTALCTFAVDLQNPRSRGRNRMCSPEREAPRKGFGMSFLQSIGCDLKGKDGERRPQDWGAETTRRLFFAPLM